MWSAQAPTDQQFWTPVHTEDLVVVVVGQPRSAKAYTHGLGKVNEVVAYDARGGKVLWQTKTEGRDIAAYNITFHRDQVALATRLDGDRTQWAGPPVGADAKNGQQHLLCLRAICWATGMHMCGSWAGMATG